MYRIKNVKWLFLSWIIFSCFNIFSPIRVSAFSSGGRVQVHEGQEGKWRNQHGFTKTKLYLANLTAICDENMSQQRALTAEKANSIHGQQVEGSMYSPLFREVYSFGLHNRRHEQTGENPAERDMKSFRRLEYSHTKSWKSCLFRLKKRRLNRFSLKCPQLLHLLLRRARLISGVHSKGKRGTDTNRNKENFDEVLVIKITVGVIKHWKRLAREMVKSPWLKIFKTWLHDIPSKLI